MHYCSLNTWQVANKLSLWNCNFVKCVMHRAPRYVRLRAHFIKCMTVTKSATTRAIALPRTESLKWPRCVLFTEHQTENCYLQTSDILRRNVP
jgi:hypothetical protein